jgi:hypothetical protein
VTLWRSLVLAVALVSGALLGVQLRAQSVWAPVYEPLTYPHPLQAEYDEDLCEDDHNAAGVTAAEIAAAVTAADDDDCVYVPSGTTTLLATVSVANKRIQVIGAGVGSTVLTCPTGGQSCFTFSGSGGNFKPFRLSGMTLTGNGASSGGIITLSNNGAGITDGFRVDNITMNGTATHGFFIGNGMFYGVIDHWTCDSGSSNTIPACGYYQAWLNGPDQNNGSGCVKGQDCDGYYSWFLRAVTLGSDDGIVVEDSTFTFNSGASCSPYCGTQDTDIGAIRLTFRYNTVTCGSFQSHGARGDQRGMASWEVYRNTFTACSAASRVNLLHNGVAHWFQNQIAQGASWGHNLTITSYRAVTGTCLSSPDPLSSCNGARSWDGNLEASGWPCLDDVGRLGGTNQGTTVTGTTWEPYKAWSNGTAASCGTGGACTSTSQWVLNSCGSPGLSDYYKPYNAPHTNAAHALGPANMWDYMDEATGGVTVYDNLSELPTSCTVNTVAWVRNAGTWNQSGNGHGSGRLYRCGQAGGSVFRFRQRAPGDEE